MATWRNGFSSLLTNFGLRGTLNIIEQTSINLVPRVLSYSSPGALRGTSRKELGEQDCTTKQFDTTDIEKKKKWQAKHTSIKFVWHSQLHIKCERISMQWIQALSFLNMSHWKQWKNVAHCLSASHHPGIYQQCARCAYGWWPRRMTSYLNLKELGQLSLQVRESGFRISGKF